MKNTIHENITQHIIDAMKTAGEFEMPWHIQSRLPVNALTNNTYNGINTLSLWVTGMKRKYKAHQWATYKQWQSMGGQVNKGEKGSAIVIYKPFYSDEDTPKVLLRSATVFNAEQVSGVGYAPISQEMVDRTDVLDEVEHYVSNTGATVEVRGDKAFYAPTLDRVVMPERHLFHGTETTTPTEAYYSTLLHELCHWTGHKSRLNRELSGRFGSSSYAMEELIAELGSAFLCAELNVTPTPRQDHANYLSHWIEVLESDQKAIFWASARASEAVAHLNSLQSK